MRFTSYVLFGNKCLCAMNKEKKKAAKRLDNHELTPRQMEFCRYYIYDWKATNAYMKAYNKTNYNSSAVEAHRMLKKPNIKAYIEELHRELEKIANVSRLKVLQEYTKIAFSNIAEIHDSWITRKEFKTLTDEQKASIQEIQTRVVKHKTSGDGMGDEVYVKLKLHDKQKALENIAKMLGYDEPTKLSISAGTTKPMIIFGDEENEDK